MCRRDGCGSFFCKDGLFESDNQRPPPRMIGSRTAGTTRGCCRSYRRRADRPRGGFTHWAWSRRPEPQPQRQQASHGLFIACLDALGSQLLAALLPLPPGGLPRLIPAPIADRIAQRQHGIDVVPTEAACRLLLTVLRRPLYWHFRHCLSQWASRLPDRWGTAYAPRACANRPVSP